MALSESEELELLQLEEEEYQASLTQGGRPNLSEMTLTPDSNIESERIPGPVESVARGAVDALPVVGATVGGIAGGTMAGVPTLGAGAPGGAVVGAAAGGAFGAGLRDVANKAFFPDKAPMSSAENLQNIGQGAMMGAGQELGGVAIGRGVQLLKAGAERGATAIGSVLKTWADDVSAATVGQSPSSMVKFGLEKTRRMGDYLMKIGATNRPAMLSTVAKEVEATRAETGKALDRAYKELDADGAAVGITKEQLVASLQERAAQSYAEKGLTPPQGMLESIAENVEKSIPGFPPGTKLLPSQTWSLAKQWEKAAGSWRKALTGAADESKSVVLDEMATGVRSMNDGLSATASRPGAQMIPTLSEHYSLLREAASGLRKEVAKGRAKTSLLSLEGLKKVYSATAASQPARGAVTGASNWTGEKLLKLGAKLGEFEPVLADAAKRGPAALAATHFTLQQQNEKYRQKLEKLSEEKR
jgi:hypothetical protein